MSEGQQPNPRRSQRLARRPLGPAPSSPPRVRFFGWLERMRYSAPPDPETEARNENEVRRLIEEVSQWVVARRLETPAILFLETHKPLTSLASHAVAFGAPYAAPLFGMERMNQIEKLMESSEHVDRLIDRIDELSHERSRQVSTRSASGAAIVEREEMR